MPSIRSCKAFRGYVQGVFRVREISEESFKIQPGSAIDVLYLDPAVLPDNSLSARIHRSCDLVVAGLTKKLRAGLG